MSTVAEIESAIKGLPPAQVREIVAWLDAHKQELIGATMPGGKSFLGFMKGKIFLKPGWDEPLEDFQEYSK
jgi:hypothetical protein